MGGVTYKFVLICGLFVLILGFDAVLGYYDDNSCYYCSDTGANPECQNYKTLRKANIHQDDKDQKIIRNCSASQNYCMVEKVIKQGLLYSYIRDCTDNKNTSFSFLKSGRLTALRPDNVTVCTFDTNTMAQLCITLCQGKLCNGPQVAAASLTWPVNIVLLSAGTFILKSIL